MKGNKKITKKMLMNCYGSEAYEMNKGLSPTAISRWLAETNQFMNNTIGAPKRLENEEKMRRSGW